MSTQQEIYAAGFENRPSMLNKDNYVPWSSRLLRYAKSKPNKKLLMKSILHGPYVRRMIVEPSDPNHIPHVAESTHEQTNDELIEKKAKQKQMSEWKRHVTTVHQTKNLYEVDYNQLYNFLKMNQEEANEIRAERLAKTHDPLALMANYKNPYNFLVVSQIYIEHRNQIGYNVGQIAGNPNGCNTVQNARNQDGNGNVVAAQAEGNGNGNNGYQIRCYNCRGLSHYARNCTIRPRRRDVAYLQTQLLIAQKEEAGIQLQAKEFDLMDASGDINEIGEIFNLFTQEEQCPELLEPITEPHLVQQNNSNVMFVESNVEHSRGIVEQHPATVEETRAYFESLYNNLAIEVEKVNTVNRKMKEANADLTTKLARYKGQEKCFQFNQAKFDELENGYKKSVYQEQCLTKKINALHLSSAKKITTLNEEIANLNNKLSKEKSIVSYLKQGREKLKSDFKTREDKLLDKLIQSEEKIKELDNILVKTGQSIQTMHMLSPKPYSFYHIEHKMALEVHKILKDEIDPIVNQIDVRVTHLEMQFLKEAGKFVQDFKSLAKEADESLDKITVLEKENERLLRAVVSQDIMSIVKVLLL
ncbi:hypothetical protein Tco_1106119 [Tanacetum coccineum]